MLLCCLLIVPVALLVWVSAPASLGFEEDCEGGGLLNPIPAWFEPSLRYEVVQVFAQQALLSSWHLWDGEAAFYRWRK